MVNKFSILNREKYFSSGIFQNYVVFVPAKRYFKYFSGISPNAKINEVKNKIPSITNLATATALNATINEIRKKLPNITNLGTTSTTASTAVEDKIPSVSDLLKKLTVTQSLVKLETKLLLIMIMIDILTLNNSIS